MNDHEIVLYSKLDAQLDTLAAAFARAQPYPHIVIDDFLEPPIAQRCLEEFPSLDSEQWLHYTHVNEKKFAKTDRKTFPPTIGETIDAVNSPRFLRFVEKLTGIDKLVADESLMGGGLHQSTAGGYLNVHADFTGHPHHANWQRRVNLLIYLNADWQDAWGGHLELWDKEMTGCIEKVAPVFNRAVLFRTDADSFHGHPIPTTCPPSVTRKSLALYYFTEETDPFLIRSTEYRARPGDGSKAALIFADKMVLRAYDKVKRTFGLNDHFAGNLLKFLPRRKRRK